MTPPDASVRYSLKEWARRVKERDGNRCQFEGCGETERLEAHHLLPRSLGGENTLENGITVCREHHRREYLRAHLHSQVEARTDRLFARRSPGKREAAYRFLSRRRLVEKS
ncbi:MAG: HNH endonuclease [candidate division Zixibacteria bacterium]|nr:HNH endonuclease [candidate division Zixibacteria bacterium]